MSEDIKKLLLPEVSYRHLITDHPMQIMEIDLTGTILFANRFDANFSTPWQLDRNILYLLEEGDRVSLAQAVQKIQQGAATAHCQVSLSHKSGGGMRFLLQLGPIVVNGQLQRLLLVMTPVQTTREIKPNDIVSPVAIRGRLLNALLANETIDVQLDNLTESFNTLLLPFPPQAGDKAGPSFESDFLPGGYLASMTHLLLCPLEPSFGNIRIRKATEVVLTFHEEEEAFRGVVGFQGALQGKDGHALKTSFPHVLESSRRRQSKRVKVPLGMAVKVLISVDRGQTLDTLLGDISANGLSFYYPQGVEPLPTNTDINLTLNIGAGRFLEIYGVLCNNHVARDGGNPYSLRKKGGVEFYPLADDDAQDKFSRFLDKLDKNFKFYLENKQRKYTFQQEEAKPVL